jgi:two-component system CheB/CheR fusion protein
MNPPVTPDSNPEFEALLNYVKRNRGFDFTGYKRSSLMRRIQKRMQMVNVESYVDYTDYLEVHPEEFTRLFDTILINVTNFFRDPAAWEYISHEIIPLIIANKGANDPIRVWSAGCASGEEAYTIAILLAEALGADRFRERVKIYASDVDEDALNQARLATYTTREVASIPPNLLEKYFESTDTRCTFRKDLRRSVIFGRHDLIQDAPISRIDLLICRNALMYFNSETQSRILTRFHFALLETGFLFLGKAEMLFTHGNLFTPYDLKRRVFTKVPRVTLRDRLLMMTQSDNDDTVDHMTKHVRFREAAFDASPVAQIVVDFNGFVALSNERARSLLGITQKDLNRPLADLEFTFRIPELRPRIEDAYSERRPVMLKETDWVTASGDVRSLEIQVSPLLEVTSGTMLGTSITFTDVTRYRHLQEELERSNQELETAYEELQSTNEELETTNEELQSTIEELETTNEELQSTNEELETINEELQSTNEELQTINEELRRRTEELNQVNSFLESILASMRGGVVVVDRDLRVQIWSHKAEDLWGLRSSEVHDKNFLNLDIGLPVDQLRNPIRACLSKEVDFEELVLNATNRRGKPIQCKVTCTPLHGASDEVRGVILLMEENISNRD